MSRKREAARQKRKKESEYKAWAESPVEAWEIEIEDDDGWDSKAHAKKAAAEGWTKLAAFLYDLSRDEVACFIRVCVILAANPKHGYDWHASQEKIDDLFNHLNEYVDHPETRMQLKRMIAETKRKRKAYLKNKHVSSGNF